MSLQAPVEAETASTLGELLPDYAAPSPYEVCVEALDSQALGEALAVLSHRERDVLELRYGLGDNDPHTLKEIGLALGVTRERARQIQAEALDKLRPLLEGRLAGIA